VEGNGSGLCSVAGFFISGVETLLSGTRYFVSITLVTSLFISSIVCYLLGLILLLPLAFRITLVIFERC
jgi:hypothetical protein